MIKRLHNIVFGFRSIIAFDNSIQIILNRLIFRKSGLVVHKIKGLEILIDYNCEEQNGTRACVANLSYDCFIKAMSLKNSPLTIVDLGANGGGFPLMLSLLGFTVKTLVAVELNPQTFSRLSFNINRNINCEAHLIQGGACERDGNTLVNLGPGSISDSLLNADSDAGIPRRINLFTLESILTAAKLERGEIDICKIDIEGSEFAILRSESSMVLTRCRYIIIEIHPSKHGTYDEAHQSLTKLGFIQSPVRSSFEDSVFLYENARNLSL